MSFILSCNKVKFKDDLSFKKDSSIELIYRDSLNNLLLTGEVLDNKLHRSLDFYSNDGKKILSFYFSNEENKLNYSFKNYDETSGRILSYMNVREGVIVEREDSISLQVINQYKGKFLYKNYCFSCHKLKVKTYTSSITSYPKLDNYFQGEVHSSLPIITNNELESIKEYIKRIK
ncbi:hypothetical protein [Tenacibaculum maritimum]|uniref:hypothetical protein n=1 Tax=Tenacibaculum maritimum TaxID=107401 RepID=UPI00133045A9|nr:hypothetical protein [Tenacibaculum maritimum]